MTRTHFKSVSDFSERMKVDLFLFLFAKESNAICTVFKTFRVLVLDEYCVCLIQLSILDTQVINDDVFFEYTFECLDIVSATSGKSCLIMKL